MLENNKQTNKQNAMSRFLSLPLLLLSFFNYEVEIIPNVFETRK